MGVNPVLVDANHLGSRFIEIEIMIDAVDRQDSAYYVYDFSLVNVCDWLTVSPENGDVGYNGEDLIGLNVNAEGLLPGFYHTYIMIHSNDPLTPSKTVTVNLEVTPTQHDVRAMNITFDGDIIRAPYDVDINLIKAPHLKRYTSERSVLWNNFTDD